MSEEKNWPELWREWMSGWGDRKNPVMPFWAKDWLADSHVKAMSHHEKGCYIDLLAYNWAEGSLPAHVQGLSAILGVHFRNFKPHTWECKLARHFVQVSEDLISNKRLILEGVRMIRERRRKRAENDRRKSGDDAVPIPPPVPSSSFPTHTGGGKEAEGSEASLLDQLGKWARCSRQKAEGIYLRLREPKAETFSAWQRHAEVEGKPAAIGAAQNYAHPDEVPPEPRKTQTETRLAEEAERKKRAREIEEQQRKRAEDAEKRERTRPEDIASLLEQYKEKKRG